MADVQRVIEILFKATDETGGALGSLADGIDSLGNKVSAVTGPLANLGNAALGAEAGVVTLGAGLLAFATNEAATFQASVNEIGTLFNATGAQAAAFGDDIQDYATRSTQSIDAINKATYAAISAGVDYKDSLGFVTDAEHLAVAGAADLSSSTVLLVSSLNAYGAAANQAADYSDALFTAVKVGQTTIPELSSSIAQVTGVAAAAKIPFDDLLASVAALTASGLPTSQAVTGIKAAITNIIQPSKEASDTAAALGLKFDAEALATRGLEGVLKDAYTATNGNVTAMGSLFGSVEGLNAALILGADSGGKFAGALQAMEDRAGATQGAYDLMAQNFDNAMQRMQNTFTVMMQDIGGPLLDDFGGSVNALAEVFNALRFNLDSTAFDPVYAAIEQASAALTTYLKGIAAALPEALDQIDTSGWVASFGDLTESVQGLFGDLDLTKPEDLARVIQMVVDSADSLNEIVAGIVESWGPALQTIAEAVDAFNQQDDATKRAAGSALGISQQIEAVIGNLGVLTGSLNLASDALAVIAAKSGVDLVASMAKAAGSVAGLGAALGSAGLVAAAGAAGYGVGSVAKDGIDSFLSSVTGSETSLGSWIYDLTHSGEEAELMGQKTEAAAAGVEKLDRAQQGAAGSTQDLGDKLGAASDGAESFQKQTVQVTDAAGKLKSVTFETQGELDAYMARLDQTNEQLRGFSQYTSQAVDTTSDMLPIIDAATGKIVGYEQNLAKAAKGAGDLGKAASETAKATAEAAKAQEEWNHKLTQMDFEARMESMKQAGAIAVATIEAQSKEMVSAFESIGESINANADLIGKLYSSTPEWDTFGWTAQELMDDANKRLNEEHEKQMQLLDAQIEAMQLRNDKLREGTPEILISAEGLEPDIEAFMFRVLERIQVKATELGAEWLLGSTGA